jgi:hypothetical protein
MSDEAKLAAAKKHYGAGTEKFKVGYYADALEEFQAADELKPTPQAARYIGLCLHKLGRYQEALVAFQRFLAGATPKMAAQVDEVRALVAAIQQLPGKVHFESDPEGAAVSVDGKPVAGTTPTDADVAPGTHMVRFEAPGHRPVVKELVVKFASPAQVDATLSVSVAAVPPPPPPPTPAP